jgi:uncharacterized protein (TIGR00730 family)
MNICVFCGSSTGTSPIYTEATKELGLLFAQTDTTLVYGGGNIGLMGVLADEVLKHKGKVIGVIPDFLAKREVAHSGLTSLEVVSSMHERKKRMADQSDAFIALPGGWGTLDELAEILTWRQLTLIDQPIGILNTNSFFDSLIQQMKKMVVDGFLRHDNLDLLKIEQNPAKLLTAVGVRKN